jgi:hypothetical protein
MNTAKAVGAAPLFHSYDVAIQVHEARALKVPGARGRRRLANAACTVRVGPTLRYRRDTDTKTDAANAVWEQQYALRDVRLTRAQLQREKVSFAVHDRRPFYANALIGSYEFTLGNGASRVCFFCVLLSFRLQTNLLYVTAFILCVTR